VISGPAGTLWGANAVNGVINIITRDSADTQSGAANGYMGTRLQQGNVRYGGALGDDAAYRVYAQAAHHDDTNPRAEGDPVSADAWRALQAGVRFDWTPGDDTVGVQGDIFRNKYTVVGATASGGNALVRWSRRFSGDSAIKLQAFYDHVHRETSGVEESIDTVDAELQHNFRLASGHEIVWGAGYRHYHESLGFAEEALFYLNHPEGNVELGNVFVQDGITLSSDIKLTLGSKFEYSNYTGAEFMPSAQLSWRPSGDKLLWASVSRAVRTPSRIDRELTADGLVSPASDFDSEELIAYEVGYRGTPFDGTSLSISLYYNDYDSLRALMMRDDGLVQFGNVLHGHIKGLEAWGEYSPRDWWRLEAGINIMEKDLQVSPPGIVAAMDQHVGNDPDWQGFLRTTMDFSPAVEFYAGLRYVDSLPDPALSSYVAADARLGWRVTDALELSVSASNIFGDHVETATADGRDIPRDVSVGANWRF
jgi:iron complex outermembrane receptor protein